MVLYDPLPSIMKESLKAEHPRGKELLDAIEWELNRNPLLRATKVDSNRYAIAYTPDIEPKIEVRVAFIVGDNTLIKVFKWGFTAEK